MWHRIYFIIFIAAACLAADILYGDIGLDEQLTTYNVDTLSLHSSLDEISSGADYGGLPKATLSLLDAILPKDVLTSVFWFFSSIIVSAVTIITYRKKINPFHGIP